MPIFQGINFNETENDNSNILNLTEIDDDIHETTIITAEDITTVTPDSEEVRAKSKAIFRPKPRVVKNVTNNVTSDNIQIVNLNTTTKYTNQTATDVVSQPQYLSDSTTLIQTDRNIKSYLATEGTNPKSLAEFLSFEKGFNILPLNKTITSDTIYVPRFHIKLNNEIDKLDHNTRNRVLKAIRYKRDIKSLRVPQVQYAPVDISFRAQHSNEKVVPPKPKLSRSFGVVATRTTIKQSEVSNTDTKQIIEKELKWSNLNKKFKMSKKVNNIGKNNQNITENVTTNGISQNLLKTLYLDVIDLKSSTGVTVTNSNQHNGEQEWLRVKRDIPESTTVNVVTIEEPKEITNLNVTTNTVIEQTVPNTILENLNSTLTKNLSEAVHEVFNELNMTALTPPDNKLPGSDMLFKIPSKYLFKVIKKIINQLISSCHNIAMHSLFKLLQTFLENTVLPVAFL